MTDGLSEEEMEAKYKKDDEQYHCDHCQYVTEDKLKFKVGPSILSDILSWGDNSHLMLISSDKRNLLLRTNMLIK